MHARKLSGRVQPLLVTLRSEEAAADLVHSSPSLQRASNSEVQSIFINPDRTPAEALAAYRQRQRRRQRQTDGMGSSQVHTSVRQLSAAAENFTPCVQNAQSHV